MKERGLGTLWYGTTDEVWGKCDDISRKPVPEIDKLKNGQNQTVGLIFTDEDVKEVTANFTLLAGAGESDPPNLDEKDLLGEDLLVTFHDGSTETIIVEDCELKRSAGKRATFMVKGTSYPGVRTAEA